LIVVDRANLDKVRAEQGFQLSGEVSDESAKAIGQLLGAGAIVTGSLTDLGDVYSLTLKAINIETATVAVSYLADLAKTTRIETLLATRDGAGSGGTSTATVSRPVSTTQAVIAQSTTPATTRQFTVTFNSNGASGMAPSAQTVQNGESITIPDVGTMVYIRGNFGGWNTRADGNGTSYMAGSTFIVNGNIQLYAIWVEQVYRIGDRGPAGGIIFYDKGNYSGGWRYLEAAPPENEFRAQFSRNMWLSVSTRDDLGSGKVNTQRLKDALELGGEITMAAHRCTQLNINGYTDWFLPSKTELSWMFVNLKERGLGGFSGDWYWSSSNGGYTFRWWTQRFSDGLQSVLSGHFNSNNDQTNSVRAIRQF